MRIVNKKELLPGYSRWILLVLSVLFSCGAFSIGEKYSEQGGYLSKAVFDVLVKNNFCFNVNECNQRGFLYGEDGNRVNLNFYGITDRKLISVVVGYVSQNGMVVTRGVPITVRFFEKPKEELMGLKAFTTDPYIILEINN